MIDTIFTNAKFADGTLNDIAVANGLIAAIVPTGVALPAANETVDLAGTLVMPGFVEGPVHLDTSFYGDA